MRAHGCIRLAAVLGMWPTLATAQEAPLSPTDDYLRSIARDCHGNMSRQFERPAEARAMLVLRIPIGDGAKDPGTGSARYAPTLDARVDYSFDGRCETRRRPLATYMLSPVQGWALGWAPGER